MCSCRCCYDVISQDQQCVLLYSPHAYADQRHGSVFTQTPICYLLIYGTRDTSAASSVRAPRYHISMARARTTIQSGRQPCPSIQECCAQRGKRATAGQLTTQRATWYHHTVSSLHRFLLVEPLRGTRTRPAVPNTTYEYCRSTMCGQHNQRIRTKTKQKLTPQVLFRYMILYYLILYIILFIFK